MRPQTAQYSGSFQAAPSLRTGEGSHSLLPHLERQAEAQIHSIRDQEPSNARETVMVAHAEWELKRTVLAQAEKRMVDRLAVYSQTGENFPMDDLATLKSARAECSKAFDALMRALDEVAASAPQTDGA